MDFRAKRPSKTYLLRAPRSSQHIAEYLKMVSLLDFYKKRNYGYVFFVMNIERSYELNEFFLD